MITTNFTANATVTAICSIGAIPKLVDIDDEYFQINERLIEKKITKKTKAIIAVHLYGQSCNINPIKKIAKKYKLKLIEDCSQAHGAEFNKKKLGNFGDIGTFSFYPTKNIGAIGDAGALITNNKKIYNKLILLREYGWIKKNLSLRKGTNKRLDELHAGILNVKLAFLEKFNNNRISIAKNYLTKIKSNKIILPKVDQFKKHVYHLFVIRIKNRKRNDFIKYLKKNNIYVGIHYPLPNHKQKPFLKYNTCNLHITEKISKDIVSIPNYPLLPKKKINKIIEVINKF